MTFLRYVPVWSGFSGAPGFTVLNFSAFGSVSDAQNCADHTATFFGAIANRIPDQATITYPGEVTEHADDGTLIGAYAIVPPLPTNCTGLGSWAAPVGARVTWETGTIVAGRRIRGRTFLVPLVSSTFDTDGTLTSANQTLIQNAANAFIANLSGDLSSIGVWSQTTSTVGVVTSATVPDQATVLRSRRD